MNEWEGYPFKNKQVEQFHALYRDQTHDHGPPWVSWRGVNALKCPLDLWIYQEILWELRPQYVIEGGTASGGSTLFLADVLGAIGHGEIISIDQDVDENRPEHKRITYLAGDTLNYATWVRVADRLRFEGPRLFVLDDGHSQEHVYKELGLVDELMRAEDYLIVEDTNLGGPLWGLDKFLSENPNRFERDETREKLLLTFNPRGYVRCVCSRP